MQWGVLAGVSGVSFGTLKPELPLPGVKFLPFQFSVLACDCTGTRALPMYCLLVPGLAGTTPHLRRGLGPRPEAQGAPVSPGALGGDDGQGLPEDGDVEPESPETGSTPGRVSRLSLGPWVVGLVVALLLWRSTGRKCPGPLGNLGLNLKQTPGRTWMGRKRSLSPIPE